MTVHLRNGAVEHLSFDPNDNTLMGLAVRSALAEAWHVDGTGRLSILVLDDEEPAFPFERMLF